MSVQPNWTSVFNPEQLERLKSIPSETHATFIGIDPSINSTGVTVLSFSTRIKGFLSATHYVITSEFRDTRLYVNCYPYGKEDHENRTNTELEHTRLQNFESISDIIIDIILNCTELPVYGIGIEGLAYSKSGGKGGGSSNILDLAGLNTLIRSKITKLINNGEFQHCKKYVNSLPPTSNKARFVKGGADKYEMWKKYCEEFGKSDTEMHEKKEAYLFDMVDSYSVARNELLEYFNENFMPKKEPKPKKDEPFTVKKRFKKQGFNLRLVEIRDENNRRAILCPAGELPLRILKSRTLKSIYEETDLYITKLFGIYGDETKDILTKKTKKCQDIFNNLKNI